MAAGASRRTRRSKKSATANRPLRPTSVSVREQIRKPERVKNTVTPTKPPRKGPSLKWKNMTSSTAIPRRPSSARM